MSRKAEFAGSVGQGMIKILWNDQSIVQGIANGEERVNRALMAVMQYNAPKCEAFMKTNANWTDQTGNARNGLRAEAFVDGNNYGIYLFHSVPYGIWLEVKFSGRYSIITPTIETMGPQVMASCQRMLDGISFR
jgi:hypothetical protein